MPPRVTGRARPGVAAKRGHLRQERPLLRVEIERALDQRGEARAGLGILDHLFQDQRPDEEHGDRVLFQQRSF